MAAILYDEKKLSDNKVTNGTDDKNKPKNSIESTTISSACSYLMDPRKFIRRVYNKTDKKEFSLKSFDEDIVNQLVSLGIASRDQCISASQSIDNYKDPNAVFEKLMEMLSNNNTNDNSSDTACELITCHHLLRLVTVLIKYHGFIEHNTTRENDQKHDNNIDNVYHDNSNMTCTLNDFHHLLDVHNGEFEEIYNILVKKCSNDNTCKLSNCLMMRRNHRDRQIFRIKDGELLALYFNTNDVNNVVNQQILDTIHCHFYHSFDIGYKLSNKQKLQIQKLAENNESKQDEYGNIINDQITLSIYKFINKEKINHVIKSKKKFVSSLEDTELKYSFGFKFFYWDYYQYSRDAWDQCLRNNLTISHSQLGNAAYVVSDFFVKSIYHNFKDEMINNKISSISATQWNNYMGKAMTHHNTNLLKSKQCCEKGQYFHPQQYYNIKPGSPITVKHIIAIMIHCNEDNLQRKFKQTYRQVSQNESHESVIKRHSEYANLGRLLVELVACFPSNDACKLLYHGTTIQSQFSSIDAYIRGPLSTSTDYTVASKFCATKGIILELWLNAHDDGIGLFDCQHISDFSNEQEIFFIGGARSFSFLSIIIAPSGINYFLYIRALLKIVKYLYRGLQNYKDGMDTIIDADENNVKEIKQISYRMMSDVLYGYYPNNKDYVKYELMPEYIRKLLNYQFLHITQIIFFFSAAWVEDFYVKLFRHLFYNDNGWIKLEILLTVFPSLRGIIVCDEETNEKFAGLSSTYTSVLSTLQNVPQSKQLRGIQINLNQDFKMIAMEAITPLMSQFEGLNWRIYVEDDGSIVMRNKNVLKKRQKFSQQT